MNGHEVISLTTGLGYSKVLTLYRKLFTNCLCINPAEGETVSTSFDIIASIINQSCDPSTFVFLEGNSLCVRSIRKLRAGDEITQCYIDVAMNFLLRRQALKSEFFFYCHCGRREMQIRSHEERFPDQCDRLQHSRQQLLDCVNEAISLAHEDQIEAHVRNIARQVFPDRDWPDDIEPLPTIRMRSAAILKVQGELGNAL
ncbi:hypothetical protein K458DRAFT_384828 [Lentithecium fluviatile CBS 122367]|uniref:SET domain-containing protein n=1 Tax=Lentithecium fluviatile CBS 122367 TaxID=1168545 RepID=A0A6G1JDJ9_9PLEO|nr:hypothetical protein K458DRAFT_384828 [Lentithecium fluviatile CBS 122367]